MTCFVLLQNCMCCVGCVTGCCEKRAAGGVGWAEEFSTDVGDKVPEVITFQPINTQHEMASAVLSDWSREGEFSEPPVMAGELRSLNDLPDEVMLKILFYFGPEDLCLVIAKVCERWKSLAKDVTLWKTLSYSCDGTSNIYHVEQVLTVAPALQSLNICGRDDVVHIVRILCDSHVDISKLILKNCYIFHYGIDILTNVVTFYPDLEALSLDGCYPLPSAAYLLISRLKKLTELNLSRCEEGLSRAIFQVIVDSCHHLKKLSLDNLYKVGEDDVMHIIKKLGKQLTSLVLNGVYLKNDVFLHLTNCARLQELGVSNCTGMTDRGLLEGIGSLQELTSLRLNNGWNLTAQAFSSFLHQACMTSIVSLNLSSCYSLDDQGLNEISQRCVRLKELDVSRCCNITDAGISMVVSHCSQLRVLNLLGLRNITGEEWLALVSAHLPHLGLLCLEGVDMVCDNDIVDFLDASQDLFIINSRGDVLGAGCYHPIDIILMPRTLKVYDFLRQLALGT